MINNFLNSYFFKTHRLEISIFVIAIILYFIYLFGAPMAFSRFPIYRAFMQSMPFFGIIAISATFVVTLGEIDLSFPSIVGITSLTFGMVLTGTEGNFFLAFLASMSLGMFAGLINGLLVTKIGIPSIVATIGTLFFWRGLVNVVAKGSGIAIVDVAEYTWHHTLFVSKVFGYIPAQFIWFLVLTLMMQWIYRYHKFGNHIHFVGDDKASAQMMGINVDNVKIIAFVQLGFFSAFAGMFTMYEMLYFWPTQGSGLMLTTLAAVFVGGTSVFGGKGTIIGSFIGVLIIGSLESGIVALGLSGFYIQFIYGLMITLSVTIYALIQRKKN
jgi:simple sugar transport system permease protein|tara:strand:- start:312 stop:1292 length:981 start_codon:yes stop_codon:yes gene_type:complete